MVRILILAAALMLPGCLKLTVEHTERVIIDTRRPPPPPPPPAPETLEAP